MVAENNSVDSPLGRCTYEEFTSVVILKQQMRVTDPVWRDFLIHLRNGEVQQHHLRMLRSLVIGNPNMPSTDSQSEPWNNAILITPPHAVRKYWNAATIRKFCTEKRYQLFICTAEDSINGNPLSPTEQHRLAMHLENSKNVKRHQKDIQKVTAFQYIISMKLIAF